MGSTAPRNPADFNFQNILYTKDGRRATVTINRPDVLNCVNLATLHELQQAFSDTLFDPDAGSDCFRAKKKLILAGKPAFIPILQRMIVTKKLLKFYVLTLSGRCCPKEQRPLSGFTK